MILHPAAPAIDLGDLQPHQLGVGARVSVHPHCDGFVDIVLGALREVDDAGLTSGLVVESDDISTWVGVRAGSWRSGPPPEEHLARYLAGLFAAASRRSGGAHVVAHVLLSRGCPGEATCDLRARELPAPAPVDLAPTGVTAVALWSLYPLLDGGRAGEGAGEHMTHIEAAIASANVRGTASGAAHYATRLAGDAAEVLATAVDAWAAVGAVVPHVTSHLTISTGSPTPPATGASTGATAEAAR